MLKNYFRVEEIAHWAKHLPYMHQPRFNPRHYLWPQALPRVLSEYRNQENNLRISRCGPIPQFFYWGLGRYHRVRRYILCMFRTLFCPLSLSGFPRSTGHIFGGLYALLDWAWQALVMKHPSSTRSLALVVSHLGQYPSATRIGPVAMSTAWEVLKGNNDVISESIYIYKGAFSLFLLLMLWPKVAHIFCCHAYKLSKVRRVFIHLPGVELL